VADATALPFGDAMFDQAILCHALEFAEPPRTVLRELWRVLAPAGEMVLIVPNRAGLWTHFEATPFGNGRPFGRRQLERLLRDSLFEPVAWRTALVAPPVRGLRWLDRPLTRIAARLGGIHLVLARKTDGAAPTMVGKVRTATALAARAT
jgi:SAM-dependent methyltransferase